MTTTTKKKLFPPAFLVFGFLHGKLKTKKNFVAHQENVDLLDLCLCVLSNDLS